MPSTFATTSAFVEEELNDRWMSTRNAVFPESLLSFLYLDMEQVRPAFQRLSDGVRRVIAEKAERNQAGSISSFVIWRIFMSTLSCFVWNGSFVWIVRGTWATSFRRIFCSAAGAELAHSDLDYKYQREICGRKNDRLLP